MSSISFSAIHTFTVVAKELSFTRAADILHITPSAVSHQMKLLESQMGGEFISQAIERRKAYIRGRKTATVRKSWCE